jgi:Raf kinase inhibitor-like YbhB/YbcL family protein
MHYPDALQGDIVHWLVWNIDPAVNELHADTNLPAGACQGTNDFGKIGYSSPQPLQGVRRYIFDLYGLDIRLDHVPEGANRATLERAMQKHVVSRTQLVGMVHI